MSTFKGILSEFPEIRIDFFRNNGQQPPLACFLSHVHSDHLQGLESLKSPFVYCSPATKEILLRLQKYPHRMNFAKGILETTVQTYKHLKSILRTIPLETPTKIELSPGNELRVTLFDANHCTGAVMFLIQGNGKAILYTGDIRSEPWWVNSLVQNPVLLPYTLESNRLNNIYLDTTFATKLEPYREFPSKAEGLRELLAKVRQYPNGTVFYFEAWTFGYENVWIALSSLLQSRVHLDRYRWGIYKSLSGKDGVPECTEAPPLLGFKLGYHKTDGCLTSNSNTRLHSCERGTGCYVDQKVPEHVRIVPIVTRLANGAEMHEMGIGGGKGDLDQTYELELDASVLGALFQLCAAQISDKDELLRIYSLLNALRQPGQAHGRLDLEEDLDKVKLDDLVDLLRKRALSSTGPRLRKDDEQGTALPREITFPYSRHSSYSELCALVRALRPKEVYPCTVDEARWTPEMMVMYEDRVQKGVGGDEHSQTDSQAFTQSFTQRSTGGATDDGHIDNQSQRVVHAQAEEFHEEFFIPPNNVSQKITPVYDFPMSDLPENVNRLASTKLSSTKTEQQHRSFVDTISPPNTKRRRKTGDKSIQQWAYAAAAGLDESCDTWDSFGGLSCVKKQRHEEIELGDN